MRVDDFSDGENNTHISEYKSRVGLHADIVWSSYTIIIIFSPTCELYRP